MPNNNWVLCFDWDPYVNKQGGMNQVFFLMPLHYVHLVTQRQKHGVFVLATLDLKLILV